MYAIIIKCITSCVSADEVTNRRDGYFYVNASGA